MIDVKSVMSKSSQQLFCICEICIQLNLLDLQVFSFIVTFIYFQIMLIIDLLINDQPKKIRQIRGSKK